MVNQKNEKSLYHQTPKVVFEKEEVESNNLNDDNSDIEFCFDESYFEVRFF